MHDTRPFGALSRPHRARAERHLPERHEATLLAVQRGSQSFVNPRTDFRIEPGDDALVPAESLKTLAPLSTVVASQAGAVHAADAGP